MIRQHVPDLLLVVVLFALGASVGWFASRHFTGQPLFYQGEFGPAVMVAAGRGFVNPVAKPGSPLAEFLALRRGSLEVGDVSGVEADPIDSLQQQTRYLMWAVGYEWKLRGIAWGNVAGVSALMFGLTIAACYAMGRVLLPRTLSAAGALFMAVSPLHLAQVPHLRDYAKAPFILAAMTMTLVCVLHPLSRRALVAVSAACAAVIGLGVGFRMDVAIMAPIFLVSVVAFMGARPWTGLRDKGLAVASFALALAMVAGPLVFRISSAGSNGFHVITLGFADQFDHALGVTRPAYTTLPIYDDRYLTTVVRTASADPALRFPSPSYDRRTRNYWLKIARNFPADVAARVLAAGNRIMNLPFNNPGLTFLSQPETRANPVWNVLSNQLPHRARAAAAFEWLSALDGVGSFLALAVIAAAAVRSVRLAVFAAAMVLLLATYGSLQFAERHVFHLEFLPVLAGLIAIRIAFRRTLPNRSEVLRFAGAAAVVVACLVVTTASLRAYQAAHLRGMLDQYVAAPRVAVQPSWTDTGAGTWRATWPSAPGDYYVIEFDGGADGALPAIELHYAAASRDTDYTRIAPIVDRPGVNRIFVPTYGERGVWEFSALEVTGSLKSRMRGIHRVTHPESLPFLLDLRLDESWRNGDLFQRLEFEDPRARAVQVLGAADGAGPSRLAWAARAWSGDGLAPGTAQVVHSPGIRIAGDHIQMDGRAETDSSYLVEFHEMRMARAGALLARGHLQTGGLTIGVLRDGRWAGQAIVSEPGDFVAIVPIDGLTAYMPIITNATRRMRDPNRFVLSSFGMR